MIIAMVRQEIQSTFNHPYTRIILLVAFGVLCLGSGWYYHQRSLASNNIQAYQLLNNVIHEFDRACQGQASWEDVIVLADIGYRRHKSNWSSLYFLIMQAYALQQEGKKQESILLWNDIIQHSNKSNPLWYIFCIKKLLLAIESIDATERQNALEQLHNLAYQVDNPYQDQALYYLGFFEPAAWQTLIEQFGSTNSSWAALKKSEE